jgi:hypothetical protein
MNNALCVIVKDYMKNMMMRLVTENAWTVTYIHLKIINKFLNENLKNEVS